MSQQPLKKREETVKTKRTPATQDLLNARMRRKDVLEYLLHRALHAQPATPAQVKAFLATAPPEVFIAVDGLRAVTADGREVGSAHDDRIVQGFVGWALENMGRAR